MSFLKQKSLHEQNIAIQQGSKHKGLISKFQDRESSGQGDIPQHLYNVRSTIMRCVMIFCKVSWIWIEKLSLSTGGADYTKL